MMPTPRIFSPNRSNQRLAAMRLIRARFTAPTAPQATSTARATTVTEVEDNTLAAPAAPTARVAAPSAADRAPRRVHFDLEDDFDVTAQNTKPWNKLFKFAVFAFAIFTVMYDKFKPNHETGLITTSDELALIDPPVEYTENCVFVPAKNYALCTELNTTSISVELPVNNTEITTPSASNMQVCGYKSYLPAFARRSALVDYTQQAASVNVTEAPISTSNPFAPLFMSFAQDAEPAIATVVAAPAVAPVADAKLNAAKAAYALRGR